MALLTRLLGRGKSQTGRGASIQRVEACPHRLRDPRWDSMADAGKADRIDHYVCRDCGQTLVEAASDKPP